MRFLAFLVVLAAIVAGVAYVTKPDERKAERALKDALLLALAKEELEGKTGAQKLALTLCRTSPNECYDLVRAGIETEFTEKPLYVQLEVAGYDHRATCYGAFTQYFCPGGLQKK